MYILYICINNQIMKKTTKLKKTKRVEITLSRTDSSFYINAWMGSNVISFPIDENIANYNSERLGLEIADYRGAIVEQKKPDL